MFYHDKMWEKIETTFNTLTNGVVFFLILAYNVQYHVEENDIVGSCLIFFFKLD